MTSALSWHNSVSLCPASFYTPRPNLPVTPGVFWLPIFIPVPYNEKDIFFGMLVLKGLVGLHRTIQLQLLQHYWSGHRVGLLWYWMVCLGNEQRSFCRFWDCIQVLHFRLLLTMRATPFLMLPISHQFGCGAGPSCLHFTPTGSLSHHHLREHGQKKTQAPRRAVPCLSYAFSLSWVALNTSYTGDKMEHSWSFHVFIFWVTKFNSCFSQSQMCSLFFAPNAATSSSACSKIHPYLLPWEFSEI